MADRPVPPLGARLRAHRGKIAVAVLLVAAWALAYLVYSAGHPQGPAKPTSQANAARLQASATAAGCRLLANDGNGFNDHTTAPVRYDRNPPLSGPHYPEPAADGVYTTAQAPSPEKVVHAQEHGRIVVQYQPDADPQTIAALAGVVAADPHHMLLVANQTRMPAAVAATAWGRGLTCPDADTSSLTAIKAFRDTYRDRGPETVP